MNKNTTHKDTTHKDSLDVCADLPLDDHELDSVSGGQLRALETFAKALQKAGQV